MPDDDNFHSVESAFGDGLRDVIETGLVPLTAEAREGWSNDIEPNLLKGPETDA